MAGLNGQKREKLPRSIDTLWTVVYSFLNHLSRPSMTGEKQQRKQSEVVAAEASTRLLLLASGNWLFGCTVFSPLVLLQVSFVVMIYDVLATTSSF